MTNFSEIAYQTTSGHVVIRHVTPFSSCFAAYEMVGSSLKVLKVFESNVKGFSEAQELCDSEFLRAQQLPKKEPKKKKTEDKYTENLVDAFLHFGKHPGPFLTISTKAVKSSDGEWLVKHEGRWRKVRTHNGMRPHIRYQLERILVQIMETSA